MPKPTKWSWVQGGIILGLISVTAYLFGDRLGTSGTYTKTVAKFVEFFSPQLVKTTFLTQPGGCDAGVVDTGLVGNLQVDWQWMVVLGIAIGAFLARKISKEVPGYIIPPMWEKRFGANKNKRFLQAFAGGFLILFGARLAGGCTSGQVISGISRLAVSGLVFGLAVFASGIPTAIYIYRRGGKQA